MNVSADDGQWSSDQKKKKKRKKRRPEESGKRMECGPWANENRGWLISPPRPHFSAMDERGIRQPGRSPLGQRTAARPVR